MMRQCIAHPAVRKSAAKRLKLPHQDIIFQKWIKKPPLRQRQDIGNIGPAADAAGYFQIRML